MKEGPGGGIESKLDAAKAILVVDDEEPVRALFSGTFGPPKYLLVAAPDGETALNLARMITFHIAFIDLRLPGMKGLEICKQLTKMQPGIKTVLMSGFFDEEVGSLMDASADVLMGKPFSPTGAREIAEHLLLVGCES